jgi:serine/threonine protein kinase
VTKDIRKALEGGTKLNNQFQIVGVIGKGGFGITYEAKDITLGRKVAIKEFFPIDYVRDPSNDIVSLFGDTEDTEANEQEDKNNSIFPTYASLPSQQEIDQQPIDSAEKNGFSICHGEIIKAIEMFPKEAKTLANLEHPQIVPIYSFFEAHNTLYVVMRYLKGRTFAYQAPLPPQEAIALIRQACVPLQFLHNRKMLHRDIKPQNLLVQGDDKAVILLDLGATEKYNVSGEAERMNVIYSPGYTPPEQYEERGRRGPFNDIYGLSATLYYLLTGDTPRPAPERLSKEVEFPAPHERNKAVSLDLSQFVMRGMALDSRERIQNIPAFLHLLDEIEITLKQREENRRRAGEENLKHDLESQRNNTNVRTTFLSAVLFIVICIATSVAWIRYQTAKSDGAFNAVPSPAPHSIPNTYTRPAYAERPFVPLTTPIASPNARAFSNLQTTPVPAFPPAVPMKRLSTGAGGGRTYTPANDAPDESPNDGTQETGSSQDQQNNTP